MSREVHAVIARDVGAPITLETILVPDPGPDEVLVKVQACGVCYTDLHHRDGRINDDSPFLLGHEAAGVVEAVGERVTNVTPGDFVVLNRQAMCGTCRACLRGRPGVCSDSSRTDAVEALRDLTRGIGADVVVDAVGHPETYRHAFHSCDLAGTVVPVGVPGPEAEVQLPLPDIFGRGGAPKSAWYGGRSPSRDFSASAGLCRQNRPDLDAFVAEKILPDGAGRGVQEDAPRRGPAPSSGAAKADRASRPLSGAFGPDAARRCDRQRRAGRRRTRSCP